MSEAINGEAKISSFENIFDTKKQLAAPVTETKFISSDVGDDPEFKLHVIMTLNRTTSTKSGGLEAFYEVKINIDSIIKSADRFTASFSFDVLDLNRVFLFSTQHISQAVKCGISEISISPTSVDPKFYDVAAYCITKSNSGQWNYCDGHPVPPDKLAKP